MTNAIENEGWDLNNPNETMSEATRSLRDRYLRTKELYPEITNKDAIAGLSKVAKKAPKVLSNYPYEHKIVREFERIGLEVYKGRMGQARAEKALKEAIVEGKKEYIERTKQREPEPIEVEKNEITSTFEIISEFRNHEKYLHKYEDVKLGERIGRGANKNAYEIDGSDNVAGVMMDTSVGNLRSQFESIIKELYLLDKISGFNISTLEMLGFTTIDGSPATIMKRYAGSYKYPKDIDFNLLNKNTIRDANTMKEKIKSSNVYIDDLQFLLTENGNLLVFDPMGFNIQATPEDVSSNLKMLNFVIDDAMMNVLRVDMGKKGWSKAKILDHFSDAISDQSVIEEFLINFSNPRVGELELKDGRYYIK